jgi:hypothetical protein
VTIKEKVEISSSARVKDSPTQLLSSPLRRSLRFVYYFHQYHLDASAAALITVSGTCASGSGEGSTADGETGTFTFAINPAPSDIYTINIDRTNIRGERLDVYDEMNELIWQCITGPFEFWCVPNGETIDFRYTTGFDLGHSCGLLLPGQSSMFSIGLKSESCDITYFNNELDSIRYSIIEGSQYGHLYSWNGDTVGTRAMAYWEYIYFRADSVVPDSVARAEILAQSKDISKIDSIEILRPKISIQVPPSEVRYGTETFLSARVLDNCNNVWIPPAGTTFTFEIIEGNRWGTLYGSTDKKEADTLIGEEVSGGFSTVDFREWDEEPIQPERVTIRVTASDSSILPGLLAFYVYPGYAMITATPTVVNYGDTIHFEVMKRRIDNYQIVPVPGGTYVDFEIVKGDSAGYLSTEDSTQNDNYIWDQIPRARFFALEESQLQDSVPVYIVANIYDDDCPWFSTGLVKFTVKGNKIMVQTIRNELRPLLDRDNKPNPNYNKLGPDKRKKIIDYSKVDTTILIVKVIDGANNPVKDYNFFISTFIRQNSGGHNHSLLRPTGRIITPLGDTVTTFHGMTNVNGEARYTYLCSGIGGIDSIFVQGTTDRDTASTIVALKMSSSYQFLQDSQHYNLIGAVPSHPFNHYGTNKLINMIKELADSVFTDSLFILRINDMSLIEGGPFDCDGNYIWDTPHQNHRQGFSVDIDNIDANNKRINEKYFRNKVIKAPFHGRFLNESTHYHITFK